MDADVSNAGRGRMAHRGFVPGADSHAAGAGARRGEHRGHSQAGWRRCRGRGTVWIEVARCGTNGKTAARAGICAAGHVERSDDSGDSGAQSGVGITAPRRTGIWTIVAVEKAVMKGVSGALLNVRSVWRKVAVRLRGSYARALEEEVARLRAENRALVNSILGLAGIPPMHVMEPGGLRLKAGKA